MERFLLQIQLGPVQDFIATARKSRDLWYGSWLLSELSKATALAIAQAEGAVNALIFPAATDFAQLAPDSPLNVSNHILAIVSGDPTEIAAAAKTAVMTRLHTLRDDAYRHVSSLIVTAAAQAQIDDMLEWYWSAVPVAEATYQDNRRLAGALLASRKGTRNFFQPSWALPVPKSSLDGGRESVIPEHHFQTGNELFLYREFGARPAERLSGIDLLKRHGQRVEESRFPSTSHMAALPYQKSLEQATDEQTAELWHQYLYTLGLARERERVPTGWLHPLMQLADGKLLFESRLSDLGLDEQQAKASAQLLNRFLQHVAGSKRPLPYYALLLGDGDSMGKILDAQTSSQAHRDVSKALAGFAEEVVTIVREHQGALVYAGGDDVLAFLPLHKAIACAAALANAFREQLDSFSDEEGNKATFSAGLAITHHIEPMSDAFALARRMEKAAKDVPGKNAFAVAIDKRSGTTRTVSGKWDVFDKRLEKLIDFHRLDAFPDGAAYQLRDSAQRLAGQNKALLHDEAKRIIRRKRAEGGTVAVNEKVETYLIEQLTAVSVDQLAEELVVTKLLADAQTQAGLPLPNLEEDNDDNLDH
ncbi:MAG: type III-B CRISPR-associated protein Cas10/Cmr2 [Chloroflexota bacterium]